MSELWGEPRLETDDDALVLVAVLTRPRDLAIAREQGWYRIPVKRAPRRVAADYLAFYQTQAFGPEACAVRYYAPVRRFHIARRAELLPDEPNHPRAGDAYYQIEIGALLRLPQPIPSRRLRRITFIPTTLKRMLAAEEINDLWWRDEPQERLWAALREAGLVVEYHYRTGEPPDEIQIDFALFCRNGRIAVLCDGQPPRDGPLSLCEGRAADYALVVAGWQVLHLSHEDLTKKLPACLNAILALVYRLGGQSG
jgi:very-short-patch-repair endonuclease